MNVTEDAPPPATVQEEKNRSRLKSAIEWVLIIAGALVVALVVKATLVQAFYIPSESMEPTLHTGDRVLVNKLSYRLHDIHRGDIVVFERPGIEADPAIKDLIKRVIGLPGETVDAHNGRIYIDGKALKEPYLPEDTVIGDVAAQRIPDDSYWVMGDNRANSSDSRRFGPIKKSLIIGRAFVRVWPVGSVKLL